MEIDVKDKRIITELSLNARAPVSAIARAVGLSKQVVKYRIENLEKRGIIEGYYAILNITKMGFAYHRIFVTFMNVNKETEAEIVDFCIKHKKVGWIAQLDGDLDCGIIVFAKDVVEFSQVYDELLSKFGEHLDEKQLSVATQIHHLKHKFLLQKIDTTDLVMGGSVTEPSIDDTDYKILGVLTKSARKSLLELGSSLRLNPKVVGYRIKRMAEEGIILGYNVKLNHLMLGYSHYKVNLHLNNMSKEDLMAIIQHILQMPESIYITRAIGPYELEFELMVRNNEEFHTLIRELRFRFARIIKNYTTFIIHHEPYINYLPLMK